MSVADRIHRDLGRPGLSVGREELPVVVIGAAVVVSVAQLSDPGSPTELLALVVAALALVVRGFVPTAPPEPFSIVVVTGAAIAVSSGSLEVGFFLVPLITLYAAWSLGSTIRAMLVAVAACAAIGVVVVVQGNEGMSPTPWLTAEIFTLVLGRTLFRQRSLIAELERARVTLADLAVADERRRIARELHDLTGHTLAATLLHVTGARHVLRRDVDEAERALLDAEAVGRASMEQIRATVAALRSTERGTDPPLPDSEQLPALVAEYRRAGLVIDAHIDAAAGSVHGPVGIALHRIGREALANVARHSPSNHVVVRIDVDDAASSVRLQVSDHGAAARPAEPGAGRFGVVGMRERVRLLGGRLDVGPIDDGWRVDVILPLTSQPEVAS